MGIRVNFTDTEKYGNSSLALDPIPTGKYHVKITDAEMRVSSSGNDMINFEFTVQNGEYEGRKVWTIASLLPHALYTLKGVMEGIGMETTGRELDLDLDDFIGKDLIAKVQMEKAGTYKDKNGETKEHGDRNVVKGFQRLEGANKGAVSGGSLLP